MTCGRTRAMSRIPRARFPAGSFLELLIAVEVAVDDVDGLRVDFR